MRIWLWCSSHLFSPPPIAPCCCYSLLYSFERSESRWLKDGEKNTDNQEHEGLLGGVITRLSLVLLPSFYAPFDSISRIISLRFLVRAALLPNGPFYAVSKMHILEKKGMDKSSASDICFLNVFSLYLYLPDWCSKQIIHLNARVHRTSGRLWTEKIT